MFCLFRQKFNAQKCRLKIKSVCHINAVLVTKIASTRCLLQAWQWVKIVFGRGLIYPRLLWGSLDLTSGEQGLAASFLWTPHPPWSGLALRPYEPHSLVPQTPPKILVTALSMRTRTLGYIKYAYHTRTYLLKNNVRVWYAYLFPGQPMAELLIYRLTIIAANKVIHHIN